MFVAGVLLRPPCTVRILPLGSPWMVSKRSYVQCRVVPAWSLSAVLPVRAWEAVGWGIRVLGGGGVVPSQYPCIGIARAQPMP